MKKEVFFFSATFMVTLESITYLCMGATIRKYLKRHAYFHICYPRSANFLVLMHLVLEYRKVKSQQLESPYLKIFKMYQIYLLWRAPFQGWILYCLTIDSL